MTNTKTGIINHHEGRYTLKVSHPVTPRCIRYYHVCVSLIYRAVFHELGPDRQINVYVAATVAVILASEHFSTLLVITLAKSAGELHVWQ